MKTVCLHDKSTIEAFLRRNPWLHLYSIGDLDDRFWPGTTWYARLEGDQVRAIALMYSGLTLPTLLALGDEDSPHLEGLIASITRLLPRRFYAHLSPGVEDILKTQYRLEPHGLHYKMALVDRCRAGDHAGEDVAALSAADLGDVLRFYAESYPGNWFEPQMLQTGAYFAKRIAGEIVSVAGVHVYSPTYRVAALGNVATHPAHRGRGHAKAVTGALCKHLLPSVDSLGLNVKADNAPAIRCYRALGFDIAASYEEWMVELV